MEKIKANHYIDTIVYSLDLALKNIKVDINQYVSTILPNLTPEQFFVLDTIYAHNKTCQQDISNLLLKDKSNIKRIVEILEKRNYIKRAVGKRNNRLVNYLEITDLGKKTVEDNIEKIKKHMLDKFTDITDEEVNILRRITDRINKKDTSDDEK